MRECDDGVHNAALPAGRPRLWHPALRRNDQEAVVHSHAFPSVLMRMAGAKKPAPVLDPARFTAGLIRLYETVLLEPVPVGILHLLGEIAKQEKKS